jgi:hypothetical protein
MYCLSLVSSISISKFDCVDEDCQNRLICINIPSKGYTLATAHNPGLYLPSYADSSTLSRYGNYCGILVLHSFALSCNVRGMLHEPMPAPWILSN